MYGPMLDQLRGVRWPARRAVSAGPAGAHRSIQRGTSGEFTEYRLYRQGDDPRALDWRLLARSDRAFVRLSDDRALLTTWVLLDGSASMQFPAVSGDRARVTKWEMARAVAVGLAAVAHASSDPVGVLATYRDGLLRIPSRTRRGTVGEIARALDALEGGGVLPLAPSLASLPQTARIVVITDCLGDHDALVRQASVLGAGGAPLTCVHIVAQEELVLPAGVHLARDPEHAGMEFILHESARDRYAGAFTAFRERVAHQWRAIGGTYTEVHTDVAPSRAVRAVIAGALGDATSSPRDR